MKLQCHFLEKPWGRSDIAARFRAPPGQKTGEIWYEGAPQAFGLLAKYLFTSEKLSIQVHPDDAQAAARGHASGKTEFWYVIDAHPGATIGIGTKARMSPSTLGEAALSGDIEDMMNWRDVAVGDSFLVPPGTIHAIGPGVTLVEIQQAADITYRLYDYGRPRELHLDDGIAVARAEPYRDSLWCHAPLANDARLTAGPPFAVQLCGTDLTGVPDDRPLLVVPLAGTIETGGNGGGCGDCFYLNNAAALYASPGARMLIAWQVP